MIAFLTSSPCVFGAPRAILNPENGLLDNLRRTLPRNPRCLFICSNPDDADATDRFGDDMVSAFREAGIEFSSFSVLDSRTDKDAQMLIWKSDLIILSGGHVPTQNTYFQKIGLKKLIRNFQGVLLGISAGTMNSAHTVYSQPEVDGDSLPSYIRFLPGLGLTNINILPHYQQAKDMIVDCRHLYNDITRIDSMGKCFYAFPDGTYIHIENGREVIRGEVHRYRDGVLETIANVGDATIAE